jgi:hypothetical protein
MGFQGWAGRANLLGINLAAVSPYECSSHRREHVQTPIEGFDWAVRGHWLAMKILHSCQYHLIFARTFKHFDIITEYFEHIYFSIWTFKFVLAGQIRRPDGGTPTRKQARGKKRSFLSSRTNANGPTWPLSAAFDMFPPLKMSLVEGVAYPSPATRGPEVPRLEWRESREGEPMFSALRDP